ncbi:MAG: adenylate kinase [Actinomycetota bacterium]
MRLIIFGPQGAGKGTQAERISEKYNVPVIATGDIFRWAISEGSPLGDRAEQFVEAGKLVPDDVTIGVMRERLGAADAMDGFVLDGFPRNLQQAKALEEILTERGVELDAAIVIEAPEEVSVRRLLGRRVCSSCGRNYHVDVPPKEDWKCDACGGDVVPRNDDNDEAIKERLRLYHEQTEPLREHYEQQGVLRVIDGVGSPDKVFERIAAVL